MDENIQELEQDTFDDGIEEAVFEDTVTYEDVSDEEREIFAGGDTDKMASLLDGEGVEGDKEMDDNVQADDTKEEVADEPNEFTAELEAIKARNAELESQQWNAEVMRRRNGDPEAGLAPDPLYAYPPEIVSAYKEVAEPMKHEMASGLANAVGMESARHFGPLVRALNDKSLSDLAQVEAALESGRAFAEGDEVFVLNAIRGIKAQISDAINGFTNGARQGLADGANAAVHDLALKMAIGTYKGVSTAQQSAIETQEATAALESEIGGMKETLAKSGLSFSDEEIAATMEEYSQLVDSGIPAKQAMERASKPLKSAFNGMQTALKARAVSKVAQATKRAGQNAAINAGGPAQKSGGPSSVQEVYSLVSKNKMSVEEGQKHINRLQGVA